MKRHDAEAASLKLAETRVAHGEPIAHEVVELLVVGRGAKRYLDGAPVVQVELVLLGVAHQHEVADEVRGREVLASRVHRLEY